MAEIQFKTIDEMMFNFYLKEADLLELASFMSNKRPFSQTVDEWIAVFCELNFAGSWWLENKNGKFYFGLFILKKYRGHRLGTVILNEIIKNARTKKIAKLYLNVRQQNLKAINLYEKFGFVKIREFVNDYGIEAFEYELLVK